MIDFLTRSIDKAYTYPCSKAAVNSAFEGVLDSASFGLSAGFTLEPRYSPQPSISGTVVMSLSVHANPNFLQRTCRASLHVYRVLKRDWSEEEHAVLLDLMHERMPKWLEQKLSRTETEIFGSDELLVELRGAELLLHETRFR